MFELGMSEIILILVVSLIVLGPERLPKVAYFLGSIIGKLQRFVSGVKAEITTQIKASELTDIKQDLQDSIQDVKKNIQDAGQQIHQEVNNIEHDLHITQSNLSTTEWQHSMNQSVLDKDLIGYNHKVLPTSLSKKARQQKKLRHIPKINTHSRKLRAKQR